MSFNNISELTCSSSLNTQGNINIFKHMLNLDHVDSIKNIFTFASFKQMVENKFKQKLVRNFNKDV